VISKDGMSEKCVHIVREKFFLNHHGWTLKIKDGIIDGFVHYQLFTRSKEIFETMAHGSAQKGMTRENFGNFKIILPSIEKQQEVLRKVEKIETQIKVLDEIKNQTEENAKFILDSYLDSN